MPETVEDFWPAPSGWTVKLLLVDNEDRLVIICDVVGWLRTSRYDIIPAFVYDGAITNMIHLNHLMADYTEKLYLTNIVFGESDDASPRRSHEPSLLS